MGTGKKEDIDPSCTPATCGVSWSEFNSFNPLVGALQKYYKDCISFKSLPILISTKQKSCKLSCRSRLAQRYTYEMVVDLGHSSSSRYLVLNNSSASSLVRSAFLQSGSLALVLCMKPIRAYDARAKIKNPQR